MLCLLAAYAARHHSMGCLVRHLRMGGLRLRWLRLWLGGGSDSQPLSLLVFQCGQRSARQGLAHHHQACGHIPPSGCIPWHGHGTTQLGKAGAILGLRSWHTVVLWPNRSTGGAGHVVRAADKATWTDVKEQRLCVEKNEKRTTQAAKKLLTSVKGKVPQFKLGYTLVLLKSTPARFGSPKRKQYQLVWKQVRSGHPPPYML